MQGTTFRKYALVAWIMQALIVVSGAAVRLTEAGLGCEDWPTCNDEQLLPEWQLHGLIEFGNRLISGLVALSAVAVLVAAYRRRPRRSDLIGYAWAVVGGTVAQVVLGGITVLADLHPIVVSVHFLLSMGLLLAAQVLWYRAGPGRDPAPDPDLDPERGSARATGPESSAERATAAEHTGPRWEQLLVRIQLTLATVVLLSGTVVTGSGPNSGDARAERLGFDLETVARVHSFFVWCLVASVVALAVGLGRNRSSGPSTAAEDTRFTIVRWLLVAVVAQGAVGYTQFAIGVPPLLVELHIAGAIIVWSLAILLHLHQSDTDPAVPHRTGESAADAAGGHQPGRPEDQVAGNGADLDRRNQPAGR